MSKSQKQRERLIELLKELFQLNQPDLDFGFYRIMHAKADKVSSFLENDLLKIVSDAFGEADDAKLDDAKLAIEKAIAQAKDFGAPDPDNTPAVLKAKEAFEQLKDAGNGETEIYDHLYRFFERYYDDGDFLSRRYYARETDGKAAAYSIPYDGREVYLHWANRDQYYIKTSEYLTNFTFNLSNAPELDGLFKAENRKIHCRIIDAAEGEHGNVKTSAANERYFIIDPEEPIIFEGNDLIIQFQYRPDVEKPAKVQNWQGKRIDEAEKAIFAALERGDDKDLLASLQTKIGENKDRTLLRKYLNQYSSRNTMDYFIHKDLGGFLNRELDFYIKNEIMRLDDIETADAPKVEFFLTKIKILRKIAKSLIEFLAQLEEFQKKIWLKKKFVVETNYCITLDRIPEELYPAIIANEAQHDEWVKLFAINELKGDLGGGFDYSNPLSIEFLKANPFLVLDTAFFDEEFKSQVLASIQGLDEQSDGLVLNSENFQAAKLVSNKYQKCFDGIYLDPPYNTDASEILYKNGYKSSSWATLIFDRLNELKPLITQVGGICLTIDDFEKDTVKAILDAVFGADNHLATVAIRSNPQGRSTVNGFAVNHEYGIFYRNSPLMKSVGRLDRSEKQINRYNEVDEDGHRYLWENFRKTGTDSLRNDREKQFYPIVVRDNGPRIPRMHWSELDKSWIIDEAINLENEEIIYPIDDSGDERVWKWGVDRVISQPSYIKVEKVGGKTQIYRRNNINLEGTLPGTWWDKAKYGAGSHGTNMLTSLFGRSKSFPFPKSLYAVEDSLRIITQNKENALVADFFGGSATTAHAIIEMNFNSKTNKKYVLAEMGEYFDYITKPRIQKAVFSRKWENGYPKTVQSLVIEYKKELSEKKKQLREISGILDKDEFEFKKQLLSGLVAEIEIKLADLSEVEVSDNVMGGISHIFKYIRLETYEDALNNLHFKNDAIRDNAVAKNDDLRREYMLKYWLEFETKNSPSLLNIDKFANPMEYKLSVKKPSSDEYIQKYVDLIETFNWLIGLWVDHIDIPRTFDANFKREIDPELPKDQETRLLVDGKITETQNGTYWFRKIEGKICRTPGDKANMDKVLVIWRKLTGDLEEDNAVLEAWFEKMRINPNDNEFDIIYINGSCTLPNDKIRTIEEAFHNKMWDVES